MDVTTLMGNKRHKRLVRYFMLGPEGFTISLERNDYTTAMLAGGHRSEVCGDPAYHSVNIKDKGTHKSVKPTRPISVLA